MMIENSSLVVMDDGRKKKQELFGLGREKALVVVMKRRMKADREEDLLSGRISAPSPAQAPERTAQAATGLGCRRTIRRSGRDGSRAVVAVVAGLHVIDGVARTSAANVVDGGLGPRVHELLVARQFLVEAEDCPLAVAAAEGVASASAPRSEFLVRRWWGQGGARGRARGFVAHGQVLGFIAGIVPCSATAGVDIGAAAARDRGVGFGDEVAQGYHVCDVLDVVGSRSKYLLREIYICVCMCS